MSTQQADVFSPDIPADTEHAAQIREEAIDWMETHYPGRLSFPPAEVLRMAGEQERRWLMPRLRAQGLGDEKEFSLPAAADALTVLFLRSRGVKFREAIDAVGGGQEAPGATGPRYGGIWNRLIRIALKRMRRRVAARLLGSAVFSLLRDPEDHPNCLIIMSPLGKEESGDARPGVVSVPHDHVYRGILERPAPWCWVLSPFRELLFLEADQLPTRSEVISRHFSELHVQTGRQSYRVQLGTMRPATVSAEPHSLEFVGRILDIIFIEVEEFLQSHSSQQLETTTVPGLQSVDDLQLWLITRLLDIVYPGSLCEISEAPKSGARGTVLASSVARPWEPSLWDPPGALEMLSGYASQVGIPLVVERVEEPWTSVIESVEPEMRFLESRPSHGRGADGYSAVALPIHLTSGASVGALYLLMPRKAPEQLRVEVRVLTVFSRIVGEIIERQRAATHTAEVSAHVASYQVLKHQEFRAALFELLTRKSEELDGREDPRRDIRLPFLLLSAHGPDANELDPDIADQLKSWIVETLGHLEWRSFIRSHLAWVMEDRGDRSFIGELPGAGVIVALDRLVTKSELDQVRDAFPKYINRASPTNAPVKLVAWVLDVPARRITEAQDDDAIQKLTDDVVGWAYDVAAVVDDVARSESLARESGEWDQALRRVRRAISKPEGRRNGYLYRIAAECSFSLGDWPGALRYSKAAGRLNRDELGSGFVRSTCQEADAHLCLGDPAQAWDLYSLAVAEAPAHPLPRYYRGQGLLLVARLLHRFEVESAEVGASTGEAADIGPEVELLVNGAMEDLAAAADRLDHWGLIPQSYQYRNFHLVPTLLGQAIGYMLGDSPGPAASRLQSARRAFPRDDLFFREYLFAKCWEQGVHRQYGALLTNGGWEPVRDRLRKEFDEPWSEGLPAPL